MADEASDQRKMQLNKNQRYCPTSFVQRHEQHAVIKDHNNPKSTAPFTMPPQINSDVTLVHFNVFLDFYLFVCSYNACRKEGF